MKIFNIFKKNSFIFYLILTLCTVLLYYKSASFDYITLDDPKYVYENEYVKKGLTSDSIKWALTTRHEGNWHPLTWISHLIDIEFFGLNPGVHHIINLIFHILNTLLLFRFFNIACRSKWKSFFTALLFAIHPLHIESVAWISERKDLLYAFFWLLAMNVYLKYYKNKSKGNYLLLIITFILSLLSKPMAVTFPFFLLLLDIWPLRQVKIAINLSSQKKLIKDLIIEKIPLLGLSLIVSIITFLLQRSAGNMNFYYKIPFFVKISNAIVSYIIYIIKALIPFKFCCLYPHAGMPPLWQVISSFLLIAGIAFLLYKKSKNAPWGIIGFFWFLGTLLPTIGIIQVGAQSMADRYTYIPLTGIFIIAVWSIDSFIKKYSKYKYLILSLSVLIVLSYMVRASFQLNYWENSKLLYKNAVKHTKDNFLIYNNLGNVYLDEKNYKKSIKYLLKGLEMPANKLKPHPFYISEINYNLGLAYYHYNDFTNASIHFQKAIRLNNKNIDAVNNLGVCYFNLKLYDMAIKQYLKAVKINSEFFYAYFNLGEAYAKLAKYEISIYYYQIFLQYFPDYTQAHINLAELYEKTGHKLKAAKHKSIAQKLEINI